MTTLSTPIPRSDLIALLAGDTVCTHCRGTGRIAVVDHRDRRPCPACRGSGLTATKATTATMRPDPRPF